MGPAFWLSPYFTDSPPSMTDASGTSSYSYDSNDKLLEVVKNGSAQLAYTYDAVGNVSTVTDQTGFVTTYTYDHRAG